jgi:hypothetical protein
MKRKLLMLTLVLSVFTMGACDDGDTGGPNQGRVTINLTDAPGDLKSAFVAIDRIILMRSGNDTTGSNRIVITPEDTGYIDLLTLTGGKVKELVDDASVSSGTFSELRVVLDEAYVITKDNRVFATSGATLPSGTTAAGELKCPSCSSSGFKVKFTGGLTVTENSTITLDFDAAQSFGHEAGSSGKWVMHPVLRATATTVRFGRITGNVALATGITMPTCGGAATDLTAFKPLAIMGTDSLTGATTAAGVYDIANALPGTYNLTYVKDITYTNGDSLTFTAAATPASVTVAQADSAKANYQITAAACH